MSIRVVNAKVYRGPGVYVGRASSLARARKLCGYMLDYSILGNEEGTVAGDSRAGAIAKYKAWLWTKIKERGPEWDALRELSNIARDGDMALVCWCAPLPCHGDVIKAAIEWLLSQPLEVG